MIKKAKISTYNSTVQYFISDELSSPITDNFFYQIAGGDIDLICRIWEMIACILVPDTSLKSFFLLQGVPDSGKSVLGKFIASFFRKEDFSTLDIHRLGDRHSTSALLGKHLNLSMDLPNNSIPPKSVAMLKMLTGNDDITIEAKYQGIRSYRNKCKFLFANNYSLRMSEYDEAFINRLVRIPFKYTIKKENQDLDLLEKLKAERNEVALKAILYWYPAIRRRKFEFTGAERDDFAPNIVYSEKHNKQQEIFIQDFAETKCKFTEFNESSIYIEDLYNAYVQHCEEKSLQPVTSKKDFSVKFEKIYSNKVLRKRWREGEKNLRGFEGVALLTNAIDYDDYDFDSNDTESTQIVQQVFNV